MARVGATEIAGVAFLQLEMHRDERGHLTEIFRDDFVPGFAPRQWHILQTEAGGLRGMHVHLKKDDYKVVLHGSVTLVLKDLRRGSPTKGATEMHELSAEDMRAILIPAGVAHGIFAHESSIVAVAVPMLYEPGDDFEFSWNDPELGVEWPAGPTLLSERDRNAPSLADLLSRVEI